MVNVKHKLCTLMKRTRTAYTRTRTQFLHADKKCAGKFFSFSSPVFTSGHGC